MPQIKSSSLVLAAMLLILVMTLFGCGDKNSQAVLEPSTGEHPANWMPVGHKTAASANILSCTACHGEDYLGGISKISCTTQSGINGIICHATSPSVNPNGCISCHGGLPSGPFGTTAPNRNLAHSVHTALLTGCATCHLNAGSGTTNHAKAAANGGFSNATIAFNAFVNTAVTASYVPANGTCSNVSCHGGKPTPVWATPTVQSNLLVAGDNNKCLSCHEFGSAAGTPQYNSFYSGFSTTLGRNLHDFHIVDQGARCTDCHNISKLTDYQLHFGGIATKSLTLPERTIGNENPNNLPTITGPTKIRFYTASTKTCNNVECHIPFNNFPGKWEQ